MGTCFSYNAYLLYCCTGSARCTYTERKAELQGQLIHNPESSFHQGHMTHFLSPGLARRDTQKKLPSGTPGSKPDQDHQDGLDWRDLQMVRSESEAAGFSFPGWRSGGEQRLSSSMFDLSCSQGSLQVRPSQLLNLPPLFPADQPPASQSHAKASLSGLRDSLFICCFTSCLF